jgi:hypothetical protein
MLDGIKPLADNILANLIQIHYPNWYQKLISVQYPKKVFIYLFIIKYIIIKINNFLIF